MLAIIFFGSSDEATESSSFSSSSSKSIENTVDLDVDLDKQSRLLGVDVSSGCFSV